MEREVREKKRDKRAREKFNSEVFLNKVRLLDEGIRNFYYQDRNGIDALRLFIHEGKKAKIENKKMSEFNDGHYSMIIQGVSALTSLNSLIRDAIARHPQLYTEEMAKFYDPNSLELNQLEFLFTHYSEGVLIYFFAYMQCMIRDEFKIDLRSRGNYIYVLSKYVTENYKYPSIWDSKALHKISSQAASIFAEVEEFEWPESNNTEDSF